MRKAWIKEEPTGHRSHPHQYRLISESTLFPGYAQPHYAAFGSARAASETAQRHGYQITGEPLTLPLVTEKDRDAYRVAAQLRAEAALNAERGLSEPVDAGNVVRLHAS